MPSRHARSHRTARWATALIASTLFPLSAIAQVVTYTFTQNAQTELTNGAYLTGTMTVDYSLMGSSRITSASLSVTAPTAVSFGIGDLGYFSTYSNTVCGVARTFDEAYFSASGYSLYLDVAQDNLNAPIPGNSGVHTSLRDPGFTLYTLANSCVTYNNPTPSPAPSGSGVYASADAQGNQPGLNAARVIDATTALSALFNGLSTDAQVSGALTQTLPLLTGGSHMATRDALSGVNRVVQARAAFNRGLSSGDGFAGDRHVWMKPFGTWAKQDDRNGVSGYGADVYGMVGGVDVDSKTDLKWGAALAYARSRVDSNSTVAAQRADVNILQLIGYGTYRMTEQTDIRFQADVGRNATDGLRSIPFASVAAASKYNSQAVHLGVALDRHFALGPRTRFTPSLQLDYTHIRDDAYTETGAGLLNLQVQARSASALDLGFITQWRHDYTDATAVLADAGVTYDLRNSATRITAAYAGAPGASFVTEGIRPGAWGTRLGLGVVHQTRQGAELIGRVDGEYRKGFHSHSVSLKARWAF